jgi:hypothetical protein
VCICVHLCVCTQLKHVKSKEHCSNCKNMSLHATRMSTYYGSLQPVTAHAYLDLSAASLDRCSNCTCIPGFVSCQYGSLQYVHMHTWICQLPVWIVAVNAHAYLDLSAASMDRCSKCTCISGFVSCQFGSLQ